MKQPEIAPGPGVAAPPPGKPERGRRTTVAAVDPITTAAVAVESQPAPIRHLGSVKSDVLKVSLSEGRQEGGGVPESTPIIREVPEIGRDQAGRRRTVKEREPETLVQSEAEQDALERPTLLVRRTVRSGQRIRYRGNVVVVGDVNPGSEITADGDIIVMGWLRGTVHAGAAGDERAVVTAFRLNPTQIRIAQHIARAPDREQEPQPEVPEYAEIRDGRLVIDRWRHNAVES